MNCIANTQTIQISSAGNPNLKAETGKSLTLGFILTPQELRSITVLPVTTMVTAVHRKI